MSPISSRKSVPPSLCSNRPTRCVMAPVNAPFSWPKSSLSSNCSGIAAQLIATKFRPARPEKRWIALAASSLPVPLSPVTITGASECETRPIILKTCCMAADWPTMESWCCSTVSCGLKVVAARISACCLSAASTTGLKLKGSDSLRRKSNAPSFIDSMTDLRGAVGAGEDDHGVRVALAHFHQQLEAAEGLQMGVADEEIGRLRGVHAVALLGVDGRDDARRRRSRAGAGPTPGNRSPDRR